jgi:LysM repeat protein
MKLYYTKQGDHLAAIAQVKNVAIEELAAMNPGVDYGELQPGMRLKLPNLATEQHVYPRSRVEYPVYPLQDEYYPGLSEHVMIASETEPDIALRGFQHHCSKEQQMPKSSVKKMPTKRKKKARTLAVQPSPFPDEETYITPSIPWMNI